MPRLVSAPHVLCSILTLDMRHVATTNGRSLARYAFPAFLPLRTTARDPPLAAISPPHTRAARLRCLYPLLPRNTRRTIHRVSGPSSDNLGDLSRAPSSWFRPCITTERRNFAANEVHSPPLSGKDARPPMLGTWIRSDNYVIISCFDRLFDECDSLCWGWCPRVASRC